MDSNILVSDAEWDVMDNEHSSIYARLDRLNYYLNHYPYIFIEPKLQEMKCISEFLSDTYFFDNFKENFHRIDVQSCDQCMENIIIIKNENKVKKEKKKQQLKEKFRLYNKSNENINMDVFMRDILGKIDKLKNELAETSQNKCIITKTELIMNEINLDLMDNSHCLEYNKRIAALAEELIVKDNEYTVLLSNNSSIMDNLVEIFHDTMVKICNLEGVLDNIELHISNNGVFSEMNLIGSVNKFIINNTVENNAILCVFIHLIGGTIKLINNTKIKTSNALTTIGTDAVRMAPWYLVQSVGINNDINVFNGIISTQKQYKYNFYVP